jgi:(1->4)-alpha-D-glucan 1-alpha-D-glucosylmutase
MGLTVDIVPNHMAIDGRANRWWWDLLENGPSSQYASHFDIDWPGEFGRTEQTVLVPVLGDRYGRVLDAGEVGLEREDGAFVVRYHDREWPVSPRSLDDLLERAAVVSHSDELAALAREFGQLPHASATDSEAVRVRHERKERLRERLAILCSAHPDVAGAVDAEVKALNADPDGLNGLLRRQNYRLAYWRVGREELDYRRFFNIETLVGLRVEDEQVFADTHATIARLVRDGTVQGLRVDHVDGLRDPGGYLQHLRRMSGETFVAVEKILHPGEHLAADWPVEGTTGYDFLTAINNLFVDPSGEEQLTQCYSSVTGESAFYSEVVRDAKLQIMTEELAPEVERLTRLLHGICDHHRLQRDRTRSEVRQALRGVLAAFPVYRTYVQPDRPVSDADRAAIESAVRTARERNHEADVDLVDFIGELLLLEWAGQAETDFALTFPQLSAPVMAKGAEDTAFYRYHRLVSLNEVGGDPAVFGRPLPDFHAACAYITESWPHTMITLATHDTKRGPDLRARVGLLSEIPDAWEAAVTAWMGMTDRHGGPRGPDYNIRYLFFQTLVGAWPIEPSRMVSYMDKAAKEAKVYTSWADPVPEYDYGLAKFIESTLADANFVAQLQAFLTDQHLVDLGRATSLAQTTLLLTCPGIPDLYQGSEVWDHRLVDPDNRRPVDFRELQDLLHATDQDDYQGARLRADQGGPKIWLVSRLLRHRRANPALYGSSTYEDLEVRGAKAAHVVAFTRGGLVVVVPRHLARLGGDWADTTVTLPSGEWRNILTGQDGHSGGWRNVDTLLGDLPVAVLERTSR